MVGVRKQCECSWDAATRSSHPKVLLATLTKGPADIESWLRFHLSQHGAGVDGVIFGAEDDATLGLLQDKAREFGGAKVKVLDRRVTSDALRNDYKSLQDRQLAFLAEAYKLAPEGAWMMHIDDDELLYVAKSGGRHRVAAEVLQEAPVYDLQVLVPNQEATYPSRAVDAGETFKCFRETSLVDVVPQTFASYANGKPIVRITNKQRAAQPVPLGPHLWGDGLSREPLAFWGLGAAFPDNGSPLYVLHFESCPFPQWRRKMDRLRTTLESASQEQQIPFPFYRASIDVLRECDTSSARGLRGGTSQSLNTDSSPCVVKEKELWKKWKTVEGRGKAVLRDLDIDWASIDGEFNKLS
jgi:hypothetical protein